MLKAGLPLDRAIKVQIDGAEPGPAAQFLMALLEALKGGKALSVGLEQFSESFGTFYINMVRSGEASGRLDTVLAELGGYLERSKAVRSSVVSAMIYPAILAVVAIISVAVMLGFVVPEFESLFEDMGDALPLMTRFILALGDFVSAWGWLAALVLTALGIWLKRWFDTPGGKGWLDQKLLALPVMGAVVNKYQVALFARTLGTLLGNGVPMLRATEIAVGTVDNQVIHQSLAELAPVIKRGGRLSDALDADIFSSMAIQMVNVGEESGSVDHMLMELAQVYESEVEAGIKRSLTLLEPALILGMGGVIAVIIMGILMGILSVNNMAV
jgi:general secretion pathway protein F